MVRRVPLRRICLVALEDQPGVGISISVGPEGEDLVTHTVVQPALVEIEQGEAGAVRAVRVQSADGILSVIWFDSPEAPP